MRKNRCSDERHEIGNKGDVHGIPSIGTKTISRAYGKNKAAAAGRLKTPRNCAARKGGMRQ